MSGRPVKAFDELARLDAVGQAGLVRRGEATLLRLASQLEEARPWSGRVPSVFATSADRVPG